MRARDAGARMTAQGSAPFGFFTEAARTASGSRLGTAMADRGWQDGVFSAVLLTFRIPSNLGTAGALAFLVLLGGYTLLRLDQAGAAMRRCWPFLVFPAVTLLSVAWADYAIVTMRAAIQLTLTAYAGLLLAHSPRPRAVLFGLLTAYGLYTLGSWLAGNTRPAGLHEGMALYGLGGEAKNFFADSTGTAALLAVCGVAAMLERRMWVMAAGLGGLVMVCVQATVAARSAGALAAVASSGALLIVLLALRKTSSLLKLLFVGAAFVVLLGCLAFFDQILAVIQHASNKDAGLTGRGYLWYRAAFYMSERPWLGVGYYSFWTPQNPEAIGLWRHFDIRQEGTAFSFHNSYIQTRVETGLIGLGALLITWLGGLLLLLRRFVMTPSLPTCFWLGYLAHELFKSPVEPIQPAALVAPTVMMYAAVGFGAFPVGSPRRTGQRAQRSGQTEMRRIS